MKNNKDHSKSALAVIIFLIFLMLIAVLFVFFYVRQNSNPSIVDLSPISVTVSSSDKSKKHNLDMQFSVKGNVRAIKKLGEEKINNIIIETISNENYEKISDKNGTEYIKEAVINELKSVCGNDIENIYIQKFYVDFTVPEENEQSTGRKQNMEGLFPNMNLNDK